MEFLINKKNVYDQRLHSLYLKNYGDNKEFPPDYQYSIILNNEDYWFHLINNKDNILACCSMTKNTQNVYIIDNVFVDEKYRGNHYSCLLLMNVIYSFPGNFSITVDKNNIAAYKTYSKVFGEPSKINGDQITFLLEEY